jgi:hypothetical protein
MTAAAQPPQWAAPRLGAIPHYQGGQWSSQDWIDHCWLHPDQMGRGEDPCPVAGFASEPAPHLGAECGLEISLWQREGGNTAVPPFLIRVCACDTRAEYLSAGSLPDALDLLGRWAPAVTADVLSFVYRELAEIHPSTASLITAVMATARANENAVQQDVARITTERAEAASEWARRRAARQAGEAVP